MNKKNLPASIPGFLKKKSPEELNRMIKISEQLNNKQPVDQHVSQEPTISPKEEVEQIVYNPNIANQKQIARSHISPKTDDTPPPLPMDAIEEIDYTKKVKSETKNSLLEKLREHKGLPYNPPNPMVSNPDEKLNPIKTKDDFDFSEELREINKPQKELENKEIIKEKKLITVKNSTHKLRTFNLLLLILLSVVAIAQYNTGKSQEKTIKVLIENQKKLEASLNSNSSNINFLMNKK